MYWDACVLGSYSIIAVWGYAILLRQTMMRNLALLHAILFILIGTLCSLFHLSAPMTIALGCAILCYYAHIVCRRAIATRRAKIAIRPDQERYMEVWTHISGI